MSSTTDKNNESKATKVAPDHCESVARRSNKRQKRDDQEQVLENEVNSEQEHNGKVSEAPDHKEINKYVTSDLWSDNPAIVLQALDNLKNLTSDNDDNCQENSKKILSLAGHMMIVAALKKHMQDNKIVAYGLRALYNIIIDGSVAYEDTHFSSILDALRSTSAIEIVLKAMEKVNEGSDGPIRSGIRLLKFLIGDSRDHALVLKNTKVKENLCGLDFIAQCMKRFPVGCTCKPGFVCDSKNRVHRCAMRLLQSIAQHEDLREYVIASGCAEQIMICLHKIGTLGDKKTYLEWKTLDTMGLIYSYKVDNSGRSYHERSCSA
jgi:hypothetical protein